ncbi:MAG TPA: hypothetical protein VGQ51_03910 [Puia sp.]|jgi:hypothetical protein|nr:hypothetical protein [Puia sp.]
MSTGGSTSDWSHSFIVECENKQRKAGFFGQHLRKYIQSDTAAVRYLNQYAAKQSFKLATSVSTVVLFSIFGISNLAQKNTPENPDPPTVNMGRKTPGLQVLISECKMLGRPGRSLWE